MQNFYLPHYNSFHVPTIFHSPFSIVLIFFIFMILLLSYRKLIFFQKGLWLLLGISIILQSVAQFTYFVEINKVFVKKSSTEKKRVVWANTFELIHCAQDKLRGHHYNGEFISSLDFSSITPSVFRYELYPVIDLISPLSSPEVRVCFQSQECATGIPNNFHVICSTNNGYIALRYLKKEH